MKKKQQIKVGTRKSALAMWQTEHVIELLKEKNDNLEFIVVPISTKGDKILDVPLAKIGDKGLFTKELEVALINREIDFAVHSVKDMPTKLPEGLKLGAMTKRHNPQDAFVAANNIKFTDLPKGATIGTSSLRRRAQLLKFRPDLNLVDIRGNLQTRLKRMKEQNLDGIILAAAGLERLGMEEHITDYLDFSICLPAVGQGSLAIEIRENDSYIENLVRSINDEETETAIRAERALLRDFEGGCQIPIGAQGRIENGSMILEALVASLDGRTLIRDNLTGDIKEPETIGIKLASLLRSAGAGKILEEIRLGEAKHNE
jgi:hydroxymethylbilane synthase